jgi:hypothetical protein
VRNQNRVAEHVSDHKEGRIVMLEEKIRCLPHSAARQEEVRKTCEHCGEVHLFIDKSLTPATIKRRITVFEKHQKQCSSEERRVPENPVPSGVVNRKCKHCHSVELTLKKSMSQKVRRERLLEFEEHERECGKLLDFPEVLFE